MGKISEQRRCRKCGNKSYSKLEGDLKIFTYSCKCGNVFSNFVFGNLKLAQMLADNPKAFFNLTVLDVVRILEEDAFKTEYYLDSYFHAQDLARFKQRLSNSPLKCRLILELCAKIQKEKGMVNRKELIELFSKKHNLKPKIVENYIEKLLEIGGLITLRDGFLLCVYSFDEIVNES